MDLIVTPGAANANAYLTVAEADARAEGDIRPSGERWLKADETTKARAIATATVQVDLFVQTVGLRAVPGQALLFPRATDVVDGQPVIPAHVKVACYEQARYLMSNAHLRDAAEAMSASELLSQADDDGSKTRDIGAATAAMLCGTARNALRQIGMGGRSGIRSVRLTSSWARLGDVTGG